MPRKRLLLLVGAAVSLLLLEAALIVALRPRAPAGPADRLKPGMPLGDVEALFGRPADLDAPAGEGKRTRMWMTKDGPVPVQFGEDDRVTDRGVLKGERPPFFDRLRRGLGW
jgi:hypothetical protein